MFVMFGDAVNVNRTDTTISKPYSMNLKVTKVKELSVLK